MQSITAKLHNRRLQSITAKLHVQRLQSITAKLHNRRLQSITAKLHVQRLQSIGAKLQKHTSIQSMRKISHMNINCSIRFWGGRGIDCFYFVVCSSINISVL